MARFPLARRARRRAGLAGTLALPAALLLAAAPALSGAVEEGRLKGAFLYNFAKYVRWPEGRLAQGDELALCLLADDATRERVVRTVEGKQAQGHPIRARALSGPGEAGACHILFVSASADVAPDAVASAVAGRSVLTVGEAEGFTRGGGVIRFLREGKRLRFEVNTAAAERAELAISSHLLKLAKVIRE